MVVLVEHLAGQRRDVGGKLESARVGGSERKRQRRYVVAKQLRPLTNDDRRVRLALFAPQFASRHLDGRGLATQAGRAELHGYLVPLALLHGRRNLNVHRHIHRLDGSNTDRVNGHAKPSER